ncbi:GNAT family N-acetyltransferase [Massilia phosphatilytica]
MTRLSWTACWPASSACAAARTCTTCSWTSAYQRRGIAQALWHAARAAALQPGHPGVFTVNASNVAVPFYASLGFERTAPMQPDSVPYNPMRRVEAGSAALVDPA